MIPWKKINLALMAALCLLTALTLKKVLQDATPVGEAHNTSLEAQEPFLINEAVEQNYQDNDRLTREVDVLNDFELSPEEVDRRYEELKYDRIVEALRTHQTGELRKIFLDHVNYELLPAGSLERLRNIAEEEGLAELFEQLHR
jgi:hypothetical protein